MSSEDYFARRICRVLDQGSDNPGSDIPERLRAMRWRAVERHGRAVAVAEFSLAGFGRSATQDTNMGHPVRAILAMLLIVLGMGIAYYWNGFEQVDVNEALDIALLADDLPPKAYLDPGFRTWLSHYVQSAR